jgi:hypothetical protein
MSDAVEGAMRRFLFALPLCFLLAPACSSSPDDTSLTDAAAKGCTPGQQIACACPGGTSSVQVCQADGTYGACIGCPASGVGGATSVGGANGLGGTSGPGGPGAGGSPKGGGSSVGGASSSTGGTSSSTGGATSMGQGGGAPGCGTKPDADGDGDGYTPAQGDCNDCDPGVNPGAFDFVEVDASGQPLPATQQVDDDCDGKAALALTACDDGLGPEIADPFDGARAIGLCNVKVPAMPTSPKDKKWGVVGAALGDIAGPFLMAPLASSASLKTGTGILPNFGPATQPLQGTRVLSLSSGQARTPTQPGYVANMCSTDKGYADVYPSSFPKDGSCGTTGQPHDGVALDLRVRVPTNAKSFSFGFRFFTCEFPMYTCTQFNDVFAVLMSPDPFPTGEPMSPDVAFELPPSGKKQVIGVNNESFLTACKPGAATMGNYANCVGEGDLAGSGFEGHGASSWLHTTVPAPSGQTIDLRFAIWDSSDGLLDTTVVVDGFTWQRESATLGTQGSGGAGSGVGGSGSGTGGSPFGGGGSGAGGDPFGGGGSSSTGGSSSAGAGGGGGGSGTSMACSDGTCSGATECCKGVGMPCGTNTMGLCL